MSDFGKWLKRRRTALGLTQKKLAQHVGCSDALLRKIEAGERRPSWQIAELLLRPLQIPETEHAAFLQWARTDLPQLVTDTPEIALNGIFPLTPLTPRENDILTLLVQGFPDALIAERLSLKIGTIRWYIKQIYSKFAVHRRHKLIRQVVEAGIVAPPQTALFTEVLSTGITLPTGLVTFLHGDIVGFMRQWQDDPDLMREALARQDSLLTPLLDQFGGHLFNVSGDSFMAAFAEPRQGLNAAATIQRQLASRAWQPLPTHWLKLTLHYGPAELRNDSDYVPNETLFYLMRISALAQEGRILLSREMAEFVRNNLPTDVWLEDLGEQPLPGRQQTVPLFQATLS